MSININAQDHQGHTGLHWAIRDGKAEDLEIQALRLLIAKGEDPRICDINGQKPYHKARRLHHFPFMYLLQVSNNHQSYPPH